MKLETFFEKFDQFADAPDAVAKMRELILTLAVQGKLVPQDPNDEPAETLCQSDEELAAASSFEVPHGWIWTRLAKLAEINGGFAFKSTAYTENGTRVVRISDFDEFGFKDHKVVRYPFSADLQKFTLEEQNILMAMTGGTVGKSYFVRSMPEPMVVNQRVSTIKVLDSAFPSYIDIVIRSEMTQEVIRKAKNSTNDNISMGDIKGFTIPLPPLAEQRRIVAKVDELMALCDRLEAQQQEREEQASKLARASLARFDDAPTSANLHFLFHPSYAISPDDIRMSILTLAIQGLLVRQAPDGDDAADYLPKPTSLQTSGLPDLPPRWTWGCVNETGRVDLGRQRAPQHHRGPNMRPYLRVQNVYEDRIDVSDVKTMNFTDTEFATFALTSGDILLNEGQSYKLVGRPAIYRGEVPGACFQNTLVRYRANSFVLPEYALVVFRAYMRNGRFQQISKQTTNIAHLSAGRFAILEFPLPPLAEQRRIVAKVEQLMALVDALETQLTASRTTAQKLLEALVAELTSTHSK